jgi:hypothetical protein
MARRSATRMRLARDARRPVALTATALTAQVGSMRVTLPSPNAASFGKFGDVPVNLYSGVPDISVPLFTAKGRTLELPVTARYHPGGIRAEEVGGWLGKWAPFFACQATSDVLLEFALQRPEVQFLVLCGHTHGNGEYMPRPNLHVITDGAVYGDPQLQGVHVLP